MKNILSIIFEANFDIENIKAHSITQQLCRRLWTVNCSGNIQHPRNLCGYTGLRALNLPTNRNSRVIKMSHRKNFKTSVVGAQVKVYRFFFLN